MFLYEKKINHEISCSNCHQCFRISVKGAQFFLAYGIPLYLIYQHRERLAYLQACSPEEKWVFALVAVMALLLFFAIKSFFIWETLQD